MDLIRGQVQFRNIPRARISGVEATSNWSHSFTVKNLLIRPGLQASLTVMDHKELEWREPLTYRPKRISALKASLRIQKFTAQMDYRYASRIEAVKIYPINNRVPMKFIDVRFTYDLGFVSLKAGVSNVHQYNYAPMESNLMPMRTFTLGIQGEL